MKSEIIDVTPVFAARLLERNSTNRNMRKRKVEQYVRDMLAGRFVTTHQGVAIYENGSLADGQHRLQAIVNSGVTCKMVVTTDVPYDDNHIMAIDSGVSRSVTDSSKITGTKVTSRQRSIAAWLEWPASNAKKTLSHGEIVELCDKYDKEICLIQRLFTKNRMGVSITAVFTAFIDAWKDGVSEDRLKSYADFLYSGSSRSGDICRHFARIRDRLLTTKVSARSDANKLRADLHKKIMTAKRKGL